jgi:WD40 repeat protein
MSNRKSLRFAQGAVLLLLAVSLPVSAQYFGQNKVQYHDFDWQVIHSDHFDIYYYGAQRPAALDAGRLAEKAYEELSAMFGYEVDHPIPLLLYASHGHFQETNVTPALISEGTGGITELVKRRVFLPFTGSYAELSHVLKHELVHAFQIERLLGKGGNLLGNQVSAPPLWVIEGMAEYYSLGGVDDNTAMWLRDAAMTGYLIDLNVLSQVGDIRVYRFGQSIMEFIGSRYGQEKVGELWIRLTSLRSFESAVQKTLGMTVEELSKRWRLHVRRTYLPQVSGRMSASETGQLLAGGTRARASYHLAPALSSDGERLAYLSDEDMFIDLYLRDEEGKTKKLVSGQRSGTFESLRFLSTTVCWSPDDELLALSVKSGGKEGIYLLDSASGKIRKKIFPGLDGIQGPSFSPDGSTLAFVGFRAGQSDLYLCDVETGTVDALTSDRYAERDPSWSPDGGRLTFATDRSPYTDFSAMSIDDWGIGVMSLDTGDISLLPRFEGKNINPVFSPDGSHIAFISDADGISNVYVWDLDSLKVGQLTNIFTGVSGLTGTSPCLSWASDEDRLAFVAFEEGRWNVYAIDDPVGRVFEWTDPPERDPVIAEDETLVEIPDTTTFMISDYKIKFSPDYLAGGAVFAPNYGIAGQSYISLSDVLGNHNITIGAAVYGSLTDSDLLLAYSNLEHRLNWGVALYQYRNDYLLFEAVDRYAFRSNIYRGGQAGFWWPFSRFSRVEMLLHFLSIDQRTYENTIYDPTLLQLDRNVLYYAAPSVAWVTDNTLWGYTGPLSGHRTRVSLQVAGGDLRYTTGISDLRYYYNVAREYVFAARGVFGVSDGKTPQRFSIGGAQSIRGYEYGEFYGTRAFLANLEFRFPLVRHLRLGFPLPLILSGVRGCLFLDTGNAWDGWDVSFFTKDGVSGFPKARDLYASYGLGARLNLGIFVLKYDLARRTDFVANTSDWESIWSLGPEF